MARSHVILLLAFVGASASLSFAQTPDSGTDSTLDWNLSLLRGSWTAHTYEMKWTLNFISDRDVVYNGRQVTYSIDDNHLRIQGRSGVIDYGYFMDQGSLRLRFPSGIWRTFEKRSDGDEESRIDGPFYELSDVLGDSGAFDEGGMIAFNDHRQFIDETGSYNQTDDSLNEGDGGEENLRDGPVLYRVEGNRILLACRSGSAGEIAIRSRDIEGNVTAVLYRGRIFHAPPEPVVALPPPGYPPPHPPGHPIPPTYPPPPPVPPITCPPKPPVLPEKRDFGPTRESKPATESNQKQTGRSTNDHR